MDLSNYIIIPLFGVTVLCCALTAIISFRRRRPRGGSRDALLWATFALIFLVFIVAKADRIVETVGNAARDELKTEHAYQDRRPLQVDLVIGAAVLGLIQAAAFSKYISHRWKRYQWALIGTGTIICFGAIRAVSLHEIDQLGNAMTVAKLIVEALASLAASGSALRRLGRMREDAAGKIDHRKEYEESPSKPGSVPET